MMYIKAFVIGGLICVIGQLLIDKTKMTPARILVSFVCAGVVLSLFGLYEPLVDFAGAGATVPISGFGHLLCKGAREAVAESGLIGALYGGVKNGAAGIAAAVFFGYVISLVCSPKVKSKK